MLYKELVNIGLNYHLVSIVRCINRTQYNLRMTYVYFNVLFRSTIQLDSCQFTLEQNTCNFLSLFLLHLVVVLVQ